MKIVQLTSDNRQLYGDFECRAPLFGTAPEALLQGFAGIRNAEVHVVSCLRQEVSSPGKLNDNIFYHSLVVPKLGWIRTGYQGCARAVRALLTQIAPDVVHGQGTEKECAIAAVYSGYPNVVTLHGNMGRIQRLGHHGNWLFGAAASILEKHALSRTNGVFCNSEHTENLAQVSARKTWLVPNAVRAEFFREQPDVRNNAVPVLLNVGLIYPLKRQLEILRCLRKVRQAGREFKLVFVGALSESTEYGKMFSREIRVAEKEGFAEYVGFLGLDALINVMDCADGLIHFPSEEAFGLVVAEGLARGLKFFGSNLGGIVDIASGIEGAELHENFESLGTGVLRWLDAGAPTPQSASRDVELRYHPHVVAERHLEIYRELISGL
ncbi:MAG: glycosyltransferase [Verrucomicrobia bacterium]|nr:MAG: glycosyltransferase [Verrucomicrobiota bacterium]TAF25863.1 MAG: glycosyltransferase [Verrucomicrobiota bacterium]